MTWSCREESRSTDQVGNPDDFQFRRACLVRLRAEGRASRSKAPDRRGLRGAPNLGGPTKSAPRSARTGLAQNDRRVAKKRAARRFRSAYWRSHQNDAGMAQLLMRRR